MLSFIIGNAFESFNWQNIMIPLIAMALVKIGLAVWVLINLLCMLCVYTCSLCTHRIGEEHRFCGLAQKKIRSQLADVLPWPVFSYWVNAAAIKFNWDWGNDMNVNYYKHEQNNGAKICTIVIFVLVVLRWFLIFESTHSEERSTAAQQWANRSNNNQNQRKKKPITLKSKFLNFLQVSRNYFIKEPTKQQVKEYSVKITGEEKICTVCCIKEANTVVNVCGHGGMCADCAKNVIKMGKCMLCRKKIDYIMVIKDLGNTKVEVLEVIS